MADEEVQAEDSAAEFASSLRDLTTNSKTLINMLTILAEESRDHAAKIVEAIESYLRTCEPSVKLPSLYLIDSIVKNVGEPYVQLFTENIVRNFVLVFQDGDERVRTALFKLRQTWKAIFPERKLYALDLNTQTVDPNWPVCAAAPIHLNPKFFKKPPAELDIARGGDPEPKSPDDKQKQVDRIQEELRKKRDEIAQKTTAKQPAKISQQKTDQDSEVVRQDSAAEISSKAVPRPGPRAKESSTLRTPAISDKANENVDSKEADSKKAKRVRERDKGGRKDERTQSNIGHNNNNKNNSNNNAVSEHRPKDVLAMVLGDTRRKDEVSSSKFRIPKKAPSGGAEVSEEAAPKRAAPKRLAHNRRRIAPIGGSMSQRTAPDDKELQTVGDIDLRLLEPRPKRRKEEASSLAFPKEDTDLRIRPKSSGPFPGQPGKNPLKDLPMDAASGPEPFEVAPQTGPIRPVVGQPSRRDPRSKKKPPLPGPPEAVGLLNAAGPPCLDGVGNPPIDPSGLSVEQLNTEAKRLLRGHPVPAGQLPLPGEFPGPMYQRQNDRVNLRLLNSLPISEPASDFGQIPLDRQLRDIRFVDGVAIAIMDEAPPNLVRARIVRFQGNPKPVIINEHHCVMATFDGEDHEFIVNGNTHRVRFGAPHREIYVDGVPYSCNFDGRPIKIRSGDDLFLVALPPPCPSVCDKMVAGPELLAKIGLRPMPPFGPIPGHLGPLDGVNPARPVIGGWVRYQDEQVGPQPPASVRPMPGMFPPPIPPNLGFRPPAGPPSGAMGGYHPRPSFGYPQMVHHPMGGPRDAVGGPLPLGGPGFPASQRSLAGNGQPAGVLEAAKQLDVSDLLSKLVKQGIIGNNASSTSNDGAATGGKDIKKEKGDQGSKRREPPVREQIPPLSFSQPAQLKQRFPGVITALHEGIQCSACGQRFQQGDKNTHDRYAQHLDWHFRLKRRGREGLRKATSRKWFFSINDWIEFEEVEDLEDRAQNYFEEQDIQQDSNSQEGSGATQSSSQELLTVEVANLPEGIGQSCELCHETFEKFFCEDSEDWRLRNAVLVDNRLLFHPVCHEDYMKPTAKPQPGSEPTADQCPAEEVTNAEEEPMDEDLPIKLEPLAEAGKSVIDEGSQSLPGLDFFPTVEDDQVPPVEVKTEAEDPPAEETDNAEPEQVEEPQAEAAEEENSGPEDAEETRIDEQAVVVEELGEFGVDTSPHKDLDEEAAGEAVASPAEANSSPTCTEGPMEDSGPAEPRPKEETKVVVKGSGGIVLKVKQDSVAVSGHATAGAASAEAVPSANSTNDAGVAAEDDEDGEGDEVRNWTPPPPDPRFKNLPPVRKGSDMSGLCSIM